MPEPLAADRKRAEEERQQLQRRLSFLAEASSVLATSLDYNTTLASVARLAVPVLGDYCSVYLLDDDGLLRRVAVAHALPEKEALAREMEDRFPTRPDVPHGPSHALRSRRTAFYPSITDEMHQAVALDPEHLRIVRALGIRSSIVVPLIAQDRLLGTISFVLTEPGRQYGPDDVSLAEDLAQRAAVAVDNALLHRALQDAARRQAESLALLDTLFASTPIGLAFIDRDLRFVRVNEALASMNGAPVADHLGKRVGEVVPDLAAHVKPLLERVIQTGQPVPGIEIEGKTPAAPDEPRHWLVSYYPIRTPDGEVAGVGAAAADITEQKSTQAERERLMQELEAERAQLEAVLQQLPSGVIIAESPTGRLVLENAQVEQIWQQPFMQAESIEGYSGYRGFHPDGRPYQPREWPLARAITDGEVVSGEEIEILRGDGTRRTILVNAAPIRGRDGRVTAGVVTFSDITDRKRAEATARLLAEAGDILNSSLDYEETLQRVAQLIVPHLADWCAVDIAGEDGTVERLAVVHSDPAKVAWVWDLWSRHRLNLDAAAWLGRVLRTGETEICPVVTEETIAETPMSDEARELVRSIGLRSVLIVPLLARGRTLGAMTLAMAESDRRYTEREVALAEELARRAALAVDNARLYRAEQRAREVAEAAAARTTRLQELTASLAAALTPAQVAAVVAGQSINAVGARAGAVYEFSSDRTALELLGAAGYTEEWTDSWQRRPLSGRTPITDAARSGEPVFLETREAIARQYPGLIADPDLQDDAAVAAIPLVLEGRVLGAITWNFSTPQAFDHDARSFLLALARQCAQALDRAHLYRAEREARAATEMARERQAFLSQASVVLASSLDYEQTLASVAEMAVPRFADWCIVRMLGEDGTIEHLAIAHQDAALRERVREHYRRYPPRYPDEHPVAQVLHTEHAILIPRLESSDRRGMVTDENHLRLMEMIAPHSVIVAPLITRGGLRGTVSFLLSGPGRRYSEDDLSLAEDLARRASVAIEHARLYQEAGRQAARVTALAEASRAFSEASLDLHAVLDVVVRRTAELMNDLCVIRLASDDGELLEPVAIYHPDPERRELAQRLLRSYPQRIDEGLNGQVMTSGVALRISHLDQHDGFRAIKPEYHEYHQRFGATGLLIVPLRVRHRVLGTLTLFRGAGGRPYTSDDEAFAQDLADRAALAIDNARLYLASQAAVQAREAFLSTASHELKTPLTTVKGYGQLLLRFLSQPEINRDRTLQLARQLLDQTGRFETLVNDLLDVSRIQQGRLALRPQPTDLAELSGAILSRFRESPERLPSHRLTLDAPAPVVGEWDPDRLDQVLTNLVSNALKYSPQGGEVRVVVRAEGDDAVVAVSDTGLGISRQEMQLIFEPFARGERVQERAGGTGLGLYIARQIVEQHGGTIGVESAVGQGSTFTVRLPSRPPVDESATDRP